MTRKKLLFLTPQFPYPPSQGTAIRNYNLVAGLARRHEVHLIAFGDPAQAVETPLQCLCSSVQVLPLPQRTMGQRLRGLFLSRLPDMALRLPSSGFSQALAVALDDKRPDVVEVEGIELAHFLFEAAARLEDRALRRPLLVFDDHNAEYLLQRRAFETDVRSTRPRGWIGAAYSFVQWQRLRRYERRACLEADRVVAVSEADAHALRRLAPGIEPAVVPNGVDAEFYAQPAAPLAGLPQVSGSDLGRPGLVFTGKMDFRPNVDAVLWFVHEVLPLILRDVPDLLFWVVGKDPHPRLARMAVHPAVRLTGWVEDVRPYIAAAAVYGIPLRIGGGTRLKVLEAMAMGKAIVSTTLGCEGFDLAPGRDLVVADTSTEFAAAVVALLRDPERRALLGQNARSLAASEYDWRVILPRLEAIYTRA
jgi:glycosyltransferase involved in cell wall biosynthesis